MKFTTLEQVLWVGDGKELGEGNQRIRLKLSAAQEKFKHVRVLRSLIASELINRIKKVLDE